MCGVGASAAMPPVPPLPPGTDASSSNQAPALLHESRRAIFVQPEASFSVKLLESDRVGRAPADPASPIAHRLRPLLQVRGHPVAQGDEEGSMESATMRPSAGA